MIFTKSYQKVTFANALAWFSLVLLLVVIMFSLDKGFEFTDESFGVLYALYPESVKIPLSLTGFATNVLFEMGGQTIPGMRLMGLLFLMLAASIFYFSLIRFLKNYFPSLNFGEKSGYLLPLFLLGSLCVYRVWWLTPSYNWLALCAALIVMSGLLGASSKNKKGVSEGIATTRHLSSGVLIGLGGVIAYMAKPTTALMLMLISFVFLAVFLKGRERTGLFFASSLIATMAMFFLVEVVASGPSAYIKSVLEGLELLSALNSGHSVDDVQKTIAVVVAGYFIAFGKVVILFVPIILAAAFIKKTGRNIESGKKYFVGYSIAISFYVLAKYTSKYWNDLYPNIGYSGFVLSVVFMVSVWIFAFFHKEPKQHLNALLAMQVLHFILFLAATSVSLGSNSGTLDLLTISSVFIVAMLYCSASMVDMFTEKSYFNYLTTGVVCISVLAVFYKAYENPFRLPASISQQTVETKMFTKGVTLKVDKYTARYVAELQESAKKAGWKPGNMLIDLTGQTPGATIVLGAEFFFTPWVIGGYTGSNDFARIIYSFGKNHELSKAWLLVAPDGSRKLDRNILSEFNMRLPDNYQLVAELEFPYRKEIQQLWKPLVD